MTTLETLKTMAAKIRQVEKEGNLYPLSVVKMGSSLVYRLSKEIDGDDMFVIRPFLKGGVDANSINSKEDVDNNLLFDIACCGLSAVGSLTDMKSVDGGVIDCSGYDYPEKEYIKERSKQYMGEIMTRLLRLKERGIVQ